MQAFCRSILCGCIGGGASMIDAELSTPFCHVVGLETSSPLSETRVCKQEPEGFSTAWCHFCRMEAASPFDFGGKLQT